MRERPKPVKIFERGRDVPGPEYPRGEATENDLYGEKITDLIMKPGVIDIVLVSYNRLDYLRRTIESLFSTVPDARFVVIDNASTDPGVREYLNSLVTPDSNVLIIHSQENKGWGSAVNSAVSLMDHSLGSPSKYLLVSNNDVEYKAGWLDEMLSLYAKYPEIGVLAAWKHISHGTLEDRGDLIVKDQMPAVGWLLDRERMKEIGPFIEKGPCATKGGNGEDVDYCIRARQAGFLVAAPKEDVAVHIDGF